MKGIYLLDNGPYERDIENIARAKNSFSLLTVAFKLPHGKYGLDFGDDLYNIWRMLREIDFFPFDFYRDGDIEGFLKRSTTGLTSVYKNGSLDSFEEFSFPAKLIVPNDRREEYNHINFPKYYLD